MDVAVIAGIIMIISVVVMLVMGVPIGISIGMSSALAMITILPFGPGIVTCAQKMFYRCELIFTAGHPLLYPGRQHYEQRRHRHTAG